MKTAGLVFQLLGILCALISAVSTRRRFSDVKFRRSVWAAVQTALRGLSKPSLPPGVDAAKSSGDVGTATEGQGLKTKVPSLPAGRWRRKIKALHDRDVQAAVEVDQVRTDSHVWYAESKKRLDDVEAHSDTRLRELAIGDFYLQVTGLFLVALGTVLSTLA